MKSGVVILPLSLNIICIDFEFKSKKPCIVGKHVRDLLEKIPLSRQHGMDDR